MRWNTAHTIACYISRELGIEIMEEREAMLPRTQQAWRKTMLIARLPHHYFNEGRMNTRS